MKYIIGVDGGGTKTKFVLYDVMGIPLKTFQSGSCHLMQVSQNQARLTLYQGVQNLIKDLDISPQDLFISLGLAGYGNQVMKRELELVTASALSPYSYHLVSDAEIALYGALDGQDGIIVIAGTGSIAYAKVGQEILRAGGWGYFLGDEGSSYWIGQHLLELFSQQLDGRLEKTILHDYLWDKFQLNEPLDLIKYSNDHFVGHRSQVAQLAKDAAKLAKEGDPHMQDLFEKAGLELGRLVQALASHFPQGCPVSTVGGLWESKDILRQAFQTSLASKFQLQAPLQAPEYGAYLIAKDLI